MKRALVFFVVILILAAVGFFVGWVQLSLGPGTYGVAFSKTSGWEPDVIVPGTFVWRWQRLLPTNFSLYVFEPRARQSAARITGTLPSGEAIASLLETRNAFDFDVNVVVTWRVRADALPALARDDDLRPEDLDSLATSIDSQVEQIAAEAVLGLIEDRPQEISLGSASASLQETVQSRVARARPGIEVLAVNATRIELPDIDLYLLSRTTVEEIIRARADALIAAAEELADIQAESDRELLLLERYGEILERYPVLLEYFRVGQELGTDPLNIESLIPQTGE